MRLTQNQRDAAANVQKGDVVVIHNKWDEPAPDPHGAADEESDANEEEAAAFFEHEVVERLLAPRGATLLMFSDWTLMDCDKKGHTCALPLTLPDDWKGCLCVA